MALTKEKDMWKTKKTYLFITVGLICLILILYFVKMKSSKKKLGPYFDASYKYFTPPPNETVAILFYPMFQKRDVNTPIALIGDKKEAERITGWTLKPKKLIESRVWLEKIMDEYEVVLKEAEEKGFYEGGVDVDWYIFFITSNTTPKLGYIRPIAIDEDENIVWDKYMKSSLLKKYFDEIGLTDVLLEGRLEFDFAPIGNYRVPPTEKTVAILLYPPYSDSGSYQPVALFGDKEMAEKLMGIIDRPLEPKKVFEGRNWLVKIMDAYRTALKEAKERKFRRGMDYKREGDIIFLTMHKGYQKGIVVDTNIVYDRYMESELLKRYFDELGLTGKLLAVEPNKAPQIDESKDINTVSVQQ
jgi:hypothetical protein